MTPAINYAKKHKIPITIHKYKHDSRAQAYGLEELEKLDLSPEQVFKTLVAQLDGGELAVAIVPVAKKLNLKLFAKACGSKKATMADKAVVQNATGYVLGGVSPLGQKKPLKTVIDSSAADCHSIFVSAGRRGLELELGPRKLLEATNGSFHSIC
ncbi:MAG: Cys-tRNA(Pro) deacylase [Deltaproteobacteria bacterium]|nr:Cys-tRNA(Pro) deacylase [Deltaproteobacteria bacterium]